jgi:hypothetical protein
MNDVDTAEDLAAEVTETNDKPQTEETGVNAKSSASRKHGKGFIYMTLRDADEALRKIDHHAKEMSKEGFARALGHDAPKGRFLHKLDALKSYTLIEVINDMVKLTPLAQDMLYGGSETSRAKARAKAFLSYDDFKRTFVEVPKNQDHSTQYLVDFVKGKLGIVNEVERFMKLFLDSAHFAGLLEGEPNPSAKSIRLRPAVLEGGNGPNETPGVGNVPAPDQFTPMPLEEVDSALESFGLASYRDRSELSQRNSGKVELKVADGKITVEIQRPVRVTIRANDLMADLPAILQSLKQKGFEA